MSLTSSSFVAISFMTSSEHQRTDSLHPSFLFLHFTAGGLMNHLPLYQELSFTMVTVVHFPNEHIDYISARATNSAAG